MKEAESRDSLLVIKIGGNIIDHAPRLADFLARFAAVPGKKILVHGGGKLATQLAENLGVVQQMVDGRRITDADTLKIVSMVYAGSINKNMVALLQSNGCDAVGLSGADGNLIRAHKRIHPTVDFGFVGDVDSVDTPFLASLLEMGKIPVLAPITSDGKGQLLNTNADTIAQETAKALSKNYAVRLVYSFEKSGVLLDVEDEASRIPVLNRETYSQLKAEQKIFAGMIPKLDNAFSALDAGVEQVIIGKAEDIHELLNGKGGTRIQHG